MWSGLHAPRHGRPGKKPSGVRQPRATRAPHPRRLARHFLLQVGEQQYALCYIRKNATNSFKELVAALSPHRDKVAECPETYISSCAASTGALPEEVATAARVVLVVRHPLDRIISVYRNKFVQRVGHERLFESYAKTTGRDPNDASFADLALVLCNSAGQ